MARRPGSPMPEEPDKTCGGVTYGKGFPHWGEARRTRACAAVFCVRRFSPDPHV